ncbi:MAG: hypothetical protein WC974_01870 [Thermoplasmata archaeon]
MSSKEELVTNKIIQIQQLERREPQLTKLDANFYENLDTHLKNLQKEYEKEHQDNPSSSKTVLLSEELRRAKQAAKEIYERRERKIVLLALSEVVGVAQDTTALTKNEKETYHGILDVLKGGRGQTFHGHPQKPETPKEIAITPVATTEESQKNMKKDEMAQNMVMEVEKGFTTADQYANKQVTTDESKNDCETVFVRITEDIPTFLGSNERVYSLTKEDVVSLPKNSAELLCKGGKAVRIV